MLAFVCSAFLHVDARERLRVHVRNLWCWSAELFFFFLKNDLLSPGSRHV